MFPFFHLLIHTKTHMSLHRCPVMPIDTQPEVKKRRITQACDYCHRRSIRCRVAGDGQGRCTNCQQFGQPCTRNRPVKKRGVKPRNDLLPGSENASVSDTPNPATLNSGSWRAAKASGPDADQINPSNSPLSDDVWKAPQAASQATIVDLVEVYFEVVYPIFPLFHRPSFTRRISRGEYTQNRGLYTVTMAVCALSSARASDNALSNPAWDVKELSRTPSTTFYRCAVDALPQTDTPDQGLETMRTYALLSLAAIQHGNARHMQAYLGKYHAMVAMDGLHNEANWPANLGNIELEERRRLFWSMYTLDVFASIVFSGVIRCREQQSNVRYTTELDDAFFDNISYRADPQSPVAASPASNASPNSWLHGWNVTTDLWRLLEHVVVKLHSRTKRKRSFLEVAANFDTSPSAITLQKEVDRIYFNLPTHFRHIDEMTGEATHDRYGYQAANITATVQLLRMVLLASEDNTIEQRCQVVSEVVHAFMRIPISYLRAISSPLLHHLGSIGSVLGGVLEEPLTDYQYRQVRTVLLSLAQLLENLDIGMHSVQVAQKLRDLVNQIDIHMASCRPGPSSPSVPIHEVDGQSLQVPENLLTDWPFKAGSMYFT